jgi:actin-related protein
MIQPNELKAEDIRHYTQQVLQAHVPLDVHGYRCQTEMILDVLLKASAESSSLEAASTDLEGSADSKTLRADLNEALESEKEKLCEQEQAMNAALAEAIPSALSRTQVEVAIVFHDEPFYGRQENLCAVTFHGQAKKGATHFVRTATA